MLILMIKIIGRVPLSFLSAETIKYVPNQNSLSNRKWGVWTSLKRNIRISPLSFVCIVSYIKWILTVATLKFILHYFSWGLRMYISSRGPFTCSPGTLVSILCLESSECTPGTHFGAFIKLKHYWVHWCNYWLNYPSVLKSIIWSKYSCSNIHS